MQNFFSFKHPVHLTKNELIKLDTTEDKRGNAEKASNGAMSPFGSFIQSMNSSQNDFNGNPQLGRIVQNFEIRHDNSMAKQFGKKTNFTMKPEIFK